MKQELCEICGKESVMRVDNHKYCAIHYVENEDKECIYEFIRCSEGLAGSEARIGTILIELKRKHPELIKDEAWNDLFKKFGI